MNNLESDNAESLFDPDMTLTSTYTLAGSGSANLSVTGGVDGSNAAVGRQVIELLDANTSSITLQVDFSSPLHARDTHNITGNWSAYYPWLLSASKASSPTNADFNLTLSNISTLDASYNLTSGINGTVSDSTIFNGLGTLSEIGETINLSVTNVGNRIGGTNENFIGLKRYLLTGTLPASETVDPDTQNGDGSNISIAELSNGIVSDHEQLVAQTATVVITRNGGGNFESGTEFYFTMDGYQGSDLYANVPEPGVSLLGLMAGLAFLGVRRRK
ncbi:MAG: PEP-CTERM sorting domain-containing protein [Verrucomicrobiae bacterium]|nr:PEP-CTERM sorting domain-containing protein [Verrucomicrobiae bacterium]